MRPRWLVSGVAVFIATVSSCGTAGSPSGGAAASAEAPGSQSAGHQAPVASASGSPAAIWAKEPVLCRSHELGVRLQAGGYSTGSDFGSIEVWNPGSERCRLAGAVAFSARFADGATDLNAARNRPLPRLAVTLPARMTPPREEEEPSGYLVASLMGSERGDPAQPDGLCRSRDELTPTVLVLSIGRVTLHIRNQDLAAPARRGISPAVYGCYGRVLLEDLAVPGQ